MNEPKPTEPTGTAVRSSELLGAYYRGSDGAATCALCNCEMEWECCSDCGGEGWHDAYEDDPIYYQPGETKPCHTCNGKGGMHWCVTKDCETNCGWKLIPAPEAPNDELKNAGPRTPDVRES